MITWKFKFVIECLPLIMQGSLLLLGCALALYFWDLSRTVSSIIIAFTVVCLLFYLFIIFAGTLSKACQFQSLYRFCYVTSFTAAETIWSKFTRLSEISYIQSTTPETNGQPGSTLPPPLAPDVDEEDSGIRADAKYTTTMVRMTKASDSVVAITAYIPEITWDRRIKPIPSIQVYQVLRDSLWPSGNGELLLNPERTVQALSSTNALLHVYTQWRCICGVDATLTSPLATRNNRLDTTSLMAVSISCPYFTLSIGHLASSLSLRFGGTSSNSANYITAGWCISFSVVRGIL